MEVVSLVQKVFRNQQANQHLKTLFEDTKSKFHKLI